MPLKSNPVVLLLRENKHQVWNKFVEVKVSLLVHKCSFSVEYLLGYFVLFFRLNFRILSKCASSLKINRTSKKM